MSLSLGRPGRRRRDDGAAAVEFALVLVLLVPLLFGMIQYGFYWYSAHAASSAAREAARKVSVGDCHDPTTLKDFVWNQLGGAIAGDETTLTVNRTFENPDGSTPTGPDTAEVGGTVEIEVSFPALDMGFIPVPNGGTVTRDFSLRVEDTVEDGVCP